MIRGCSQTQTQLIFERFFFQFFDRFAGHSLATKPRINQKSGKKRSKKQSVYVCEHPLRFFLFVLSLFVIFPFHVEGNPFAINFPVKEKLTHEDYINVQNQLKKIDVE